ncbi:MAG TPA: transposase [Candidatus Bathyarchaeia archaeon]|nr:transposase [Candidatus Bathyarchaeia archaeon]
MLDMDSRLRVARAIEKDETQASISVFRILQRRGHPDSPPPTISDGWGGIDEAMVEVYGVVPEYGGRGRPPTRKKPGSDWLYLQMVKQRDEQGRFEGTKLRVIFGTKAEGIDLLGESTAYIERSNLTSRLFNGRQVRKTLAFSKEIEAYRAAAAWEDSYYNLIRPHKSLRLPVRDGSPRKRLPRTPAMAARLTDHIWTVKELLTTIPLRC